MVIDIDRFKCLLESCEYINPDEITPNDTLIIKHKHYAESAPTNWHICNDYMICKDNGIMLFNNLKEIEIFDWSLGRKVLVYIPDNFRSLPTVSRSFHSNEIYMLRLTDSAKLLLEFSKGNIL